MYPLTSEDFEQKESLFGYSPDEIEQLALEHVEQALFSNNYSPHDFEITAVRVFGSRMADTHKPDSDLDVLVIYDADIRDDDFFSMVNDPAMWIEDCKVDVFPERDRSLETMLEMDAQHQLDKIRG